MFQMPYPDVPRYTCGVYGAWQLIEMPASRQYGYFTPARDEAGYYGLVRDGRVWMTTSRMERESHAFHLSVAQGRVVVCGVGMGMFLYNVCRLDRVRQVIAVDIDADVIEFLQRATNLATWTGREKIRFVQSDARTITTEQLGPEPIDFLYVDIWPDLGGASAAAETRQIQSAVCAKRVGYWGQEIDFGRWHAARRATGRPHMLEGKDFSRDVRLPLGPLPQMYLESCCVATQLFMAKVREDEQLARPA